MRSYLVVANQTLGGPELLDLVREAMREQDCEFHIVVPATPIPHGGTWTEQEAVAVAQRRLYAAIERFSSIEATVTGEVGDGSPMQAIRDALRDRIVDEVILSTLPPGISRWLKMDLPARVERGFGLPVTVVVNASDLAKV